MKRLDLIRHLELHGCAFLREGAKHSVYVYRAKRKSSTVPVGQGLATHPYRVLQLRRSRRLDTVNTKARTVEQWFHRLHLWSHLPMATPSPCVLGRASNRERVG